MIKSKRVYYTIAICNALNYHLTVGDLPDESIVKSEKTYLNLGKKDRFQR